MEVLLAIYAVVNAAGFWMMKDDKQRAKKNQFRISERTLWTGAFLGGALGMAAGMKIFRHKTKHFQFKWGLPGLAAVQAAALLSLL